MTNSEKVPILGIFSPKTILMFRVGLKKLGYVGNRNHTYISFKPKLGLMCLAQGHKAVTPVRLKLGAPRSQVNHSTTEPLRSLLVRPLQSRYIFVFLYYFFHLPS